MEFHDYYLEKLILCIQFCLKKTRLQDILLFVDPINSISEFAVLELVFRARRRKQKKEFTLDSPTLKTDQGLFFDDESLDIFRNCVETWERLASKAKS
uniref:Uncharacterized protein n=1 Tax=Steinernema glaseri TaxID=37863 RepID=A0A1I7ZLG1_9BILA